MFGACRGVCAMTLRTLAVTGVCVAGLMASQLGAQSREHWVGTWSTAETWRPAVPAAPPAPPPGQATPPRPVQFNNQTVRQVVHTSLGGERLRVVLSNAFGTAP